MCKLSVTLLFVIYREIPDKKELYKGHRIRPEKEKIDPCKKRSLVIVNTNCETIPRGLNFFSRLSQMIHYRRV